MKPILINLDLKQNNYEDIELKQGCQDTLIATISDLGDVVDLAGQVISVELLKGDKTFIIQTNDITVSANKVTIKLNKDFTRVKGKTKLQIKMTKDGVVSGSWVVVAWVREGAIDSAIGESDNIVTIKEELDNSIVKATEENKKTQDLIQNGGAATKGEVKVISSQLEDKANKTESVTKGFGTLDDFDEPTRLMIQGINPGNINAVLGDSNVTSFNIKDHSINADKIANSSSLFTRERIIEGKYVSGENVDKTIQIQTDTSCGVYSIPIPSKGTIRIKVLEVRGQLITFLMKGLVVTRRDYTSIINSKGVTNSWLYINDDASELILDCEKIKDRADCIYLTIPLSGINSFYMVGDYVKSIKDFDWLLENKPLYPINISNLNDIISHDNIIPDQSITGYDLTTLRPLYVSDYNKYIFKLDITTFRDYIIELGYSDKIPLISGQRYVGLDGQNQVLFNRSFSSCKGIVALNLPLLIQKYPSLVRMEFVFLKADKISNCLRKIKSLAIDGSYDPINKIMSIGQDLMGGIVHGRRLAGYDSDSMIDARASEDYLYMVIDKPLNGKIKVPFSLNPDYQNYQAFLQVDENGLCFSNHHLNAVLLNSSSRTTYVEGDDFYHIILDNIDARTKKFVIGSSYYVNDWYLEGINTLDITTIKSFDAKKLLDSKGESQEEIIMPNSLVLLEGKQISLYYNNVFRYADTDLIYNITTSNAPEYSKRFARWDTSLVQNYTSTINVYAPGNSKTYNTKTLGCKVISNKEGEGMNKKVLFIGDSITDSSTYSSEIVNLFKEDVMDITLLGTRGISSTGANHEGRSGWRAWEYVNLASGEYGYMGENAFYNPTKSKFDFTYYMNKNKYDNVDYVFLNLGTNDLVRPHHSTDEDIVASYNFIINSIKEFNAEVKILLWLPPMRALGMINTSKRDTDYALRATQLLINTFDKREGDNIFLVPVYFNIDPYHDYSISEVSVSSRNPLFTEYKCNDKVHPSREGYYKIADVIQGYIKYMTTL